MTTISEASSSNKLLELATSSASLRRDCDPANPYSLSADESKVRRKNKRPDRETPRPLPFFACPFYKFDPVRYSETDVPCSRIHLRNIPRVKEHLYNVHWAISMSPDAEWPNHTLKVASTLCPDSYVTDNVTNTAHFSTDTAHSSRVPQNKITTQSVSLLGDPIHSGSPVSASTRVPGSKRAHDASEDLTHDQYLEIKIKRPRQDERAAWYGLYRAAIPGTVLPASPYVDPNNETSRFFDRVRSQGPEELERRIREQFRTLTRRSDKPSSQQNTPENDNVVLNIAARVVLEEFLRTSVRHEDGSLVGADPSVNSLLSPPAYTASADNRDLESQASVVPGPDAGGEKHHGDAIGQGSSSAPRQTLEFPQTFHCDPHQGPSPPHDVQLEAYAMENREENRPTLHTDAGLYQRSSYDTTYTTSDAPMTNQPSSYSLDKIPNLPGYNATVHSGLEINNSVQHMPQNLDAAHVDIQDPSFALHLTESLANRHDKIVSEKVQKKPSKTYGKTTRPMTCITIKGPHKHKAPDECLTWSSSDIYSIQRHEMMKHSAFYTKHQAILLKGIGKKKDPVARWLAHWEIVSGEEHQGKIDPYYYSPEPGGHMSAVAFAKSSGSPAEVTPAALKQVELYKTRREIIIEHFKRQKLRIEQARVDAVAEFPHLIQNLTRLIDQKAGEADKKAFVEKSNALQALSIDFDQGRTLDSEDIVAKYAQQAYFEGFSNHKILAEVTASCVGELDNKYTAGVASVVTAESKSTDQAQVLPAAPDYCFCVEPQWGCVSCGKYLDFSDTVYDLERPC